MITNSQSGRIDEIASGMHGSAFGGDGGALLRGLSGIPEREAQRG
jgi:hypothetical protein